MFPTLSSKLRSTLARASALLVLAGAGCLSAQTTLNVGPGQTYTTIQSGINAANAGDTVLVAPGTYFENIDFLGKAITITTSAGPATTILDGGRGQNPAVIFRNGETSSSVLNGFTIQNGGFSGYPQPSTNYGTGGIVIDNATPVISNNVLTHNECNAIQSNFSSPLIENNEIDNTLDPNGYCGFAGGSAIWIYGSLTYYNGGSQTTEPPAIIVGNLIQNNVESGRADAGGNGGAAIAVWGGYASITSNTLRNNLSLGDGGAILAFNTDPINIIGNLIYGNQASTDGAISLQPPSESVGPFIGIVASNTIYGNTQTAQMGGAGDSPPTQVYLDGNLGQYLLINNIIVASGANTVAVGCGTVYNYLSLTPLVFDHNDLYNPDGAAYGGACSNQAGTYGNISADPKFSNPSANNYQLLAGSPAIDTGNNSAPLTPSTDIAGSPRIQDATNLGYPVIDMGAYEFSGVQDKSPTILDLTPSDYDAHPTPPLTFTVALTSAAGTPSGPVTIYEDQGSLATVTVGPSGTYLYTPPLLTPGLHAFVATYPGSGVFPPAVSVKFFLLVPLVNTTVNLTSSPNSSFVGQPVLFTITASAADNTIPSPITLTDTTTNTLLATLTPNASGVATYTTSTLSLGIHSLLAAYAGTSSYNPSSSGLSQDVVTDPANDTITTLTCNPSTLAIDTTSLFSATVSSASGTPTGSIIFTDNGTALSQPTLTNGAVSYLLTARQSGTRTIIATYVPTGSFAASSASCVLTVSGAATVATLSVAPTLANEGSPITLTANVSGGPPGSRGSPVGTITFYNGSTVIDTGAHLTSGTATFTTTILPPGIDYLTCTYPGNATFAPSTCNIVAVTITQGSPAIILASSLNPAPSLTPITFTAQVAPGSSGTIVFNVNGQNITTTPNAAGISTTTTSSLTPGSYLITATYYATPNALAAQASLNQVVTVPVAAPDFSLTGTDTSVVINHTVTGRLLLASLGTFSGSVALTCTPPYPPGYTCKLQASNVSLPFGFSTYDGYTLTPNYSASSQPFARSTRVALTGLFPLGFFGLLGLAHKRRTTIRTFLCLVVLAALASMTTACGPDHFIPLTTGTYPLTFTGIGASQNDPAPITHTVTINVTIAP
jgi:hypothetical protein